MKIKVTILFIVIATALTLGILKKDFTPDGKNEGLVESSTPVAVYKKTIFDQLISTEVVGYQEQKLTISENLKDKSVVIIHFWASWCSPCVNEIPELIGFAKKNKITTDNLRKTIIAVSLDENKEDLFKFLKSFPELDTDLFIRIWDNKNVLAKIANADRLPMTIILDNNRSEPVVIRGQADWKGME